MLYSQESKHVTERSRNKWYLQSKNKLPLGSRRQHSTLLWNLQKGCHPHRLGFRLLRSSRLVLQASRFTVRQVLMLIGQGVDPAQNNLLCLISQSYSIMMKTHMNTLKFFQGISTDRMNTGALFE